MTRVYPVWVLLIAGVVLALTPGARAQQPGLAGNEHPEAELVSQTEAANPFEPTPAPPSRSVQDKRALAEALDLEPLRSLPVSHAGRVKPLDTLARDTVRMITARGVYFDLERVEGRKASRKLRYDPLFTFFDMMIDPAYYADKPLIHVEFLPLREGLLELAYPSDEEQRERWKKIGRLPPTLINAHMPAMWAAYEFDDAHRRGRSKVNVGLGLFVQSWQNLFLVAPESTDDEWPHISQLSESHPARAELDNLVAAWRAGDAEAANKAIVAMADALGSINPEMHPGSRAGVELAYNRFQPFEWGFWVYLVSLIALLLAFGTGRAWLGAFGVTTLFVAVLFHGAGFTARCIIAERFAIQNQFESMMGLSLFAALVGLGIMILRRQPLFGAAAAGVGFMVLLTAQAGVPGMTIEREAAILNTSWLLKYHVTTVLSSYGLIALGMMCSLFFLLTHYTAKLRPSATQADAGAAGGGVAEVSAEALGLGGDAPRGPQRVLSDLDTAQMVVLQLAFWTLGVGILLGAWWADHSWGRWWAFDPKETWALITWIVYLIVIHLRFSIAGKRRALVTAWLSIVGFIVMIFTYFGVNLLLPGLHAYA